MSKLKKIRDYQKLHGTVKTINWLGNNVKYRMQKLKSKPIEYDYLSISEEEKNYVIPKNKGNIFIFASVAFYDIGGGQRSAQLAKIYNKLGYQVFYIFAFDSSETKKFKMDIPCVLHKHIKNVNLEKLMAYVNEDDIAIFEAPYKLFKDYLKPLKDKKVKIVYENIDNWESHLGNQVFDADTLKLILENADLLTATALPLIEQLNIYLNRFEIKTKKPLYLPNAVDDELFNPHKEYDKPTDLMPGTKTLLYYGTLWGDWFDWDLLINLANSNPDITINLIGDASSLDKSQMPSNIYFLGLKKQIDLPAYLAHSDFAILPFKVDAVGKYVSPLKVFEYISMYKKIIATPLPDIIGYPNLETGNTYKQWQKILNSKKKVNETNSSLFIKENNWYERCFNILEHLKVKGLKKCLNKFYDNISIIVLNHNNEKVIFHCVDTLLENRERYNYEIIVVDNQSTDGSLEKLQKTYKNNKIVKIVSNNKNGCSSGRNLGVENATKDYIFFLDSDQWIFHKYWLDVYLDIFASTKDIGALAWGAGWFNDYGLSYRFVDNYPYRSMPPQLLARKDIGYLATCGFIMKKKLFNEVKGFDEAYDPTCYEDTDLALKVRNSGLEIYYSPYLGVGHIPHQTTKAGSSKHDELILEKGNYFVQKWKEINPDLLKYKK